MMRVILISSLAAALAACGGNGAPGAEPAATTTTNAALLARDPSALVVAPTAQGTTVRLDGQYGTAAVARRNPNGSLSIECFDDAPAADAFMRGAPAAPEVR